MDEIGRKLRARMGGLALSAKTDPAERMAKARWGRWQKYLERADPDGVLSEEERHRRADALRRADIARMQLKARQNRALTVKGAKKAEAKQGAV